MPDNLWPDFAKEPPPRTVRRVLLEIADGLAERTQRQIQCLVDTKPAAKASTKTSAPAKATTKTHVVEGEVVSADATAKTLTVKVAGEDKTVPVHGNRLHTLTVRTA